MLSLIRSLRRCLLLAVIAVGISAVAGQQPDLLIEAVADVNVETRTPIAFKFKTNAKNTRFIVDKLRKDGKVVPPPPNLFVDALTGDVKWTPSPAQAGNYELKVVAKTKDDDAGTTVKIAVKPGAITTDGGEVGKLLKQWYADGTAAGNTGDFYDNRDRDHSALNRAMFPQLDEVMYSKADRDVRRDWAGQNTILPVVTFGNSSTSSGVTAWGSNPRMYMTQPGGLAFLYNEYRNNNLYIYPAHHDHHPGHNGKPFYGDVFPTNTPYLLISQGSSGSDQPFMRAVPLTLAAFRPDVKKKLAEKGLLMPTIQMILRSTNKHLTDPKEYLTGKAHPPVFEGSWVNDLKMIQMAHEMEADKLAPMIQMKVVEEDAPVIGKDYFEPGILEKLHDTPATISRVVRGSKYVRRMVVTAEDSFDINQKPLKFTWVVLRGDAQRIKINPLNESGSKVELLVPYHARQPVAGSPLKIDSNRVDIGVFVHNGTYYSAPGFVTFYSFDNEMRTYDDAGKLLEIGYGPGDADLTVTDWNALFDALASDDKAWAAKRFQGAFTPEQRKALNQVAGAYRTAAEALNKAQLASQQADKARQKAAADAKAAQEKFTAAQKANEKTPTDETLMAYKKAGQENADADESRKKAEATNQAAQKELEAARKTADGILSQKQGGSDGVVKDVVEAALTSLKQDWTFAVDASKDTDAAMSDDAGRRNRVQAARKRLAGFGVLTQKGNAEAITSIRTGNGPLADRLTGYEKNLIERFNADVLATLYPKFLRHDFKANFVDFRLTTNKNGRDVYHHDAKGNIIGWTRYDGDKATEFNAAGSVVLEKDAKGRAIKAQTVKYEIDNKVPPPSVRPLKQLPGDQIQYYEYAGDDDFIGKVAREVKVGT